MITRKIKIGEFFYYFSRSIQNTPHHSYSLFEATTFEGGGDCMSVSGTQPFYFKLKTIITYVYWPLKAQFPTFIPICKQKYIFPPLHKIKYDNSIGSHHRIHNICKSFATLTSIYGNLIISQCWNLMHDNLIVYQCWKIYMEQSMMNVSDAYFV